MKELEEAGSAQVQIKFCEISFSSYFSIPPQIGEVKSGAAGIAEFCAKREIERYQK